MWRAGAMRDSLQAIGQHRERWGQAVLGHAGSMHRTPQLMHGSRCCYQNQPAGRRSHPPERYEHNGAQDDGAGYPAGRPHTDAVLLLLNLREPTGCRHASAGGAG